MTPAEAWEHAKALWPSVTTIYKFDGTTRIRELGGNEKSPVFSVDWPEGMTEYPSPQKLYRPAIVPTVGKFDDYGKEAEFSDDLDFASYDTGLINGCFLPPLTSRIFWVRNNIVSMYMFCRIPLGPEWRSMDTAPKDGTEVVLLMGGKKLRGEFSGKTMWYSNSSMNVNWDEANQPVAWKPIEETK